MSGPKVIVLQGELEGLRRESSKGKEYFSFLGIPYAQPPVGILRFQNPLPATSWCGVRDATAEGNIAPQICPDMNEYAGDEDCLYLNVHTPYLPKVEKEEGFPVIISIHGGIFTFGSGTEKFFNPEYIMEKGCVFVSMNYRLNVLGFLCLQNAYAPGNMGLQDQHLAIRWVKENIQSFGGDPQNITLFGNSSGAMSVESHIISSKSWPGLFHKAIIQSGSIICPGVIDKKHFNRAVRLGKKFGKDTKNPKELFDLFQNLPCKELVEGASQTINDIDVTNGLYVGFSPVYCNSYGSDAFFDKSPIEILRSGKFMQIPILSGLCNREGIYLKKVYGKYDLDLEKFSDLLPNTFLVDKEDFEIRINAVYKKRDSDMNDDDGILNYLSDLGYAGGMFTAMELRLKSLPQEYLYCFTYDGSINFLKVLHKFKQKGACHADELTYLGKNHLVDMEKAQPLDFLVSERMVKMWTNFAKTGNPTPEIDDVINVKWLPSTNKHLKILNIGEKLEMQEHFTEYEEERRQLWVDLYKFFKE